MRQLPSGRWQVRYRSSDGRLRPAGQTYVTKTEASRALAEIETEVTSGQWLDPARGRVPLRLYAEEWLVARRVRGRLLALRTKDTYRNSLDKWILPTFGGQMLAD
ncbi:MAG: site-specific integrase, partial [Actinobacteria bacterium]|nr:site-specific integrase [Actinomycetota bacterium]